MLVMGKACWQAFPGESAASMPHVPQSAKSSTAYTAVEYTLRP